MYTDAEKNGQVGAVLVDVASKEVQFTMASVPKEIRRRLLSRATQINAFEASAVAFGLHTFREELRGKRVVVFIDNTVALNTIIKGWSRKPDLNQLAFTTWLLLEEVQVEAHFAYVRSKLNLADGPSRRKLQEMCRMDAVEVDGGWPTVEEFE